MKRVSQDKVCGARSFLLMLREDFKMKAPTLFSSPLHYFLNPTDFTTFQTDFNTMGVSKRFRKNVFHYTLG